MHICIYDFLAKVVTDGQQMGRVVYEAKYGIEIVEA